MPLQKHQQPGVFVGNGGHTLAGQWGTRGPPQRPTRAPAFPRGTPRDGEKPTAAPPPARTAPTGKRFFGPGALHRTASPPDRRRRYCGPRTQTKTPAAGGSNPVPVRDLVVRQHHFPIRIQSKAGNTTNEREFFFFAYHCTKTNATLYVHNEPRQRTTTDEHFYRKYLPYPKA